MDHLYVNIARRSTREDLLSELTPEQRAAWLEGEADIAREYAPRDSYEHDICPVAVGA